MSLFYYFIFIFLPLFSYGINIGIDVAVLDGDLYSISERDHLLTGSILVGGEKGEAVVWGGRTSTRTVIQHGEARSGRGRRRWLQFDLHGDRSTRRGEKVAKRKFW